MKFNELARVEQERNITWAVEDLIREEELAKQYDLSQSLTESLQEIRKKYLSPRKACVCRPPCEAVSFIDEKLSFDKWPEEVQWMPTVVKRELEKKEF